jgi:hypothetical protein
MTAYPLTVNLPEAVFQQLSRLAQLTQQPVETLVLQSITGNLPPQPEQSPPALQPALLEMQNFSVQELLAVAHEEILPHQQEHHLDLLDKNADDRIAADERQELHELGIQADQLMLRKAYAWALLRWHGHPVPALNELPLS